jgi:hypothetical protein
MEGASCIQIGNRRIVTLKARALKRLLLICVGVALSCNAGQAVDESITPTTERIIAGLSAAESAKVSADADKEFNPLPIGIDFGPGFSNPSIGFNPPALIGIPGSPIFQWPVGRPPGNWVINPGYWGRVRPAIPGIGHATPGPSGWRNAGRYLGPIWQIINLGQELGCLRDCLNNYKCENGGVW